MKNVIKTILAITFAGTLLLGTVGSVQANPTSPTSSSISLENNK